MEQPLPQQPAPSSRKRPAAWVWIVVASLALLVAALVFATVVYLLPPQSSTPSATSDQQATSKSQDDTPKTEAPTPEQTTQPAAAIVVSSCEAFWPERYAIAKAYAERYSTEILYDDIGDYRFSDSFGPAAQTALSQGLQVRGCVYLTNSETFIRTHVTELPSAARETFLAALRADSDFVESSVDGALVFEWKTVSGGHWEFAYTTHSFIDNVWIAGYGPQPATDYVPQITAAILDANPTLRAP